MKKCVVYIFICLWTGVLSQTCSVLLNDITNTQNPLFVKRIGTEEQLHFPEHNGDRYKVAWSWQNGEEGRIICGDKNNIKDQQTTEIRFQCTNGQLINLGTKSPINFQTLQCSGNFKPSTQKTSTSCGSGTITNVGFSHMNSFFKFYEICYDYNNAAVIYTRHTIDGKAIQFSARPQDRWAEFFKDQLEYIIPGDPYKRPNQEKRFTDIRESINSQSNAIKNDRNSLYFLSRGHLTPNADGISSTIRVATFFYLNVAPQWQIFNACNWNLVEIISRAMAYALNDKLQVTTGVSGVLRMSNTRSRSDQNLYLATNNKQKDLIPVPKFYWKILKYNNDAVALIGLNNPYATAQSEVDICQDKCKALGYPDDINSQFQNFALGRTYCCSVKELADKYPNDIPNDLKGNYGLLSYKTSKFRVSIPREC